MTDSETLGTEQSKEKPPRFYAPLVDKYGDGVIEHPLREEPKQWGTVAPAPKGKAAIIAARLRAEMPRGDIGEDGMGDTTSAGRSGR